MLTEAATYDELYRNFRWDIPSRFNIATYCCDRHADGTGRLALVYVDEDGGSWHVRRCFDRYSSYDPDSDTYVGYDGYRHYCRL